MDHKPTSSKPGKKPGKEDKPLRFMDLPPELRNIVYRFTVVKTSCFTLVPPALAHVSKQICNEVLPVYYGKSSFLIKMDIDVLEYDEDDISVKQDDHTKLNEFLRMCSCIADTGGLGYIKTLQLSYNEPALKDVHDFLFGFDLIGTGEGNERVGDANLRWRNRGEVTKAVTTTMKRCVGPWTERLKARVPVSNVIEVLFALAKHCHRANHYVELWWDYGPSKGPGVSEFFYKQP